jgi:hypothetical protein
MLAEAIELGPEGADSTRLTTMPGDLALGPFGT